MFVNCVFVLLKEYSSFAIALSEPTEFLNIDHNYGHIVNRELFLLQGLLNQMIGHPMAFSVHLYMAQNLLLVHFLFILTKISKNLYLPQSICGQDQVLVFRGKLILRYIRLARDIFFITGISD
jgi:hypothetical protein